MTPPIGPPGAKVKARPRFFALRGGRLIVPEPPHRGDGDHCMRGWLGASAAATPTPGGSGSARVERAPVAAVRAPRAALLGAQR